MRGTQARRRTVDVALGRRLQRFSEQSSGVSGARGSVSVGRPFTEPHTCRSHFLFTQQHPQDQGREASTTPGVAHNL